MTRMLLFLALIASAPLTAQASLRNFGQDDPAGTCNISTLARMTMYDFFDEPTDEQQAEMKAEKDRLTAVITRGAGIDKEALAKAYYERHELYFDDDDDLSGAIGDLSKAIEADPDWVTPYIDRADFYQSLGKLKLALADFSKAIELKPEKESYYKYRGAVYTNMGQHQRAIVDYRRSLELTDDKTPHVLHDLACNLSMLGRNGEAIEELTKRIEWLKGQSGYDEEDLGSYHYHRAIIYRRMGQGKKAIKDLHRTLSLYDKHNAARMVLKELGGY